MTPARRIGVFGGTFDPPHHGHTAVARAAREALNLDRLEWVVSATPPHRAAPVADVFDRFAMVTLATLDEPAMIPSAREIRRGGSSFMIDTLRELRAEAAGAELFLIIGADSYDDLDNWRDPAGIRAVAQLAVVPRLGANGPQALNPRPGERAVAIEMPLAAHAARAIRQELESGRDADGLIHPAVLRYLRKRGLYHGEHNGP